ncbi:hypothetical protein pb186bvf_019652 [Paramecium bursaria]
MSQKYLLNFNTNQYYHNYEIPIFVHQIQKVFLLVQFINYNNLIRQFGFYNINKIKFYVIYYILMELLSQIASISIPLQKEINFFKMKVNN